MIHYKKDMMISEHATDRLIRVHKDDIEAFVEKFQEILDNGEKITVFSSSDESEKFYNSLYKPFKDIKILRV
jgi:hypothetical protein